MNIELKDRKAIVTGSTAGIGCATAEGLARAGASVVINGRGNARVDEAVRQIHVISRLFRAAADSRRNSNGRD